MWEPLQRRKANKAMMQKPYRPERGVTPVTPNTCQPSLEPTDAKR
jgi:hypothetical protein